MRIQQHHQATWINDAYNANPDSMKAALTWLSEFAVPDQLILILGDMAEIGDYAAESHLDILRTARSFFAESWQSAKICVRLPQLWNQINVLSTPFLLPGKPCPLSVNR